MSTPYDTALKLQARLVEGLRRDIADAAGREAMLAGEVRTIGSALHTEMAVAASDPMMARGGFAVAQLGRRREAAAAQQAAAGEVAALQARTREALGLKVALDELAMAARLRQRRAAEAAEQQAMDDQTERRRRR